MSDDISRRDAMAGAGLAAATLAAGQAQGATPTAEIVIYHIEGRRSQRLVWLCEELGLPYKLVYTRGDVGASHRAIKEANPLMPLAPTLRYGNDLLVESGALLQFLLDRHGGGRLEPAKNSPDRGVHLMWLHFAEGTAMPRISGDMARMRATGATQITPNVFPGSTAQLVGTLEVVKYVEAHLAAHPYFGGREFTAADIMMDFVVRTMNRLPLEPVQWERFADWRDRVRERPGYKRTLAAALPDGRAPDEARTTAALTGKAP
jgi:glutathione S-transferase